LWPAEIWSRQRRRNSGECDREPAGKEEQAFSKKAGKKVLTVLVGGDIIPIKISEDPCTSQSQAARQALKKGNRVSGIEGDKMPGPGVGCQLMTTVVTKQLSTGENQLLT
jgi:hypothetical protein